MIDDTRLYNSYRRLGIDANTQSNVAVTPSQLLQRPASLPQAPGHARDLVDAAISQVLHDGAHVIPGVVHAKLSKCA